jgi:hypothetical protein
MDRREVLSRRDSRVNNSYQKRRQKAKMRD